MDICSGTTHFAVAREDSHLSFLFPARDVSPAKCPKGRGENGRYFIYDYYYVPKLTYYILLYLIIIL